MEKMTRSYEEWLINSLHDKHKAAAYLQVALDHFKKDSDAEALLLALRHVTAALSN